MNLFYHPNIRNGQYFLDENESRHCIKVLRLSNGDTINVIDGYGGRYKVRITTAHPKKCEFDIIEKHQDDPSKYFIHIAIAPTKNLDRIEWFVEKSVEFGIHRISFIQCDNSERKVIKTERIKRKVIEAAKQSLKSSVPKIDELMSFNSFVKNVDEKNKYIAYVDFENEKNLKSVASDTSYCVLIGPEGDFTNDELTLAVEKGFQKVSLGSSRLRTETAGVAACHILNLINEV